MKAHWKYLKYVLRHKWFVYVAGRELGVSFWRLIKHDWDKFLPSEWNPYVAYFYGSNVGYSAILKRVEERFNYAWNLHQKRADHHWQFWLLIEDSGKTVPLDMPKQAMLEMVADWYGAGRAISGHWEADVWYYENRKRINLSPDTAERVHALFVNRKEMRCRIQMMGISCPPF